MASHLTMAFVMDPIEGIDIEKDTTFLLMWEAQERGHRVLYVDPADLGVAERRASARAWPVTLRRERGGHVERGSVCSLVLDDDVDVAWQRTDPPVDAAYVTATQILGLCRRTLVLNRPDVIEKCHKAYLEAGSDVIETNTFNSNAPSMADYGMEELVGELNRTCFTEHNNTMCVVFAKPHQPDACLGGSFQHEHSRQHGEGGEVVLKVLLARGDGLDSHEPRLVRLHDLIDEREMHREG